MYLVATFLKLKGNLCLINKRDALLSLLFNYLYEERYYYYYYYYYKLEIILFSFHCRVIR